MSQPQAPSLIVAPPHSPRQYARAGAFFLLLHFLLIIGIALLVHEWEIGSAGNVLVIAAVLLFCILFATRAFIHFARQRVLNPFHLLSNRARAMEQGDMSCRIGDLENEHLSAVGRALDVMADRIQASDARTVALVRELQAAEARYRALGEDQTELILRIAPDGRLTFVNDAFCRSCSLSPDQALGNSWFIPMNPYDLGRVKAALSGLSPEHPTSTGQYRILVNEGHDRWYQFKARGIFDSEGQLAEVNIVARDVTERQQVEEALLEVNAGLESHMLDRMAELARAHEQIATAQARLGQLLAAAPAVVYSCRVSEQFPTAFITENVKSLLGYEAREFTEDPDFWQSRLHPEDHAALGDVFRRLNEQNRLTLEYRFKGADGAYRWLSDAIRVVRNEKGEPVELVGSFMDISERKEMEQALAESRERYELAVRGANEGLWDWDLDKNRIYYSPRWKSQLGYQEGEIGDSIAEWYGRVHVQDLSKLQADLEEHLRGNRPRFENEHRILDSEGHYRWVLTHGVAICRADGQGYRMVGSMTDVTARKEAEERLVYGSLHEPLTGLPNRALFMDRLSQVLKRRASEQARRAAVLVIDLDRFQVVNNSLGHLLSDQLLVAVAQRFESAVRPTDTVARLGGDEFAILLDRISSPMEAVGTAERVQQELVAPFHVDGHEITLTASIGIAMTPEESRERIAPTATDILRGADTAMNRAKSAGRNRYAVYEESMHTRAMAALELEADLRRAIERNEFEVHYQPILSLVDARISGAEALVRWRHPERGLIFPDKFIPLAEETGLIEPIGDSIFRAACVQAQVWRTQCDPEFQVAVNFSGLQFQNPRLVDCIQDVLFETGLPPSGLKIEITETTLMRDLAQSRKILHRLDEMGVEISIDDFGNSYSALGQLRQFPVKVLKIDQSFLRNVPEDLNNKALTTAIIAMARSLSLRVIAEGVETQDQLLFLHAEGCDEIQGFLFSRPVTPETFVKQWPVLDSMLETLIQRRVMPKERTIG